MTADEWRALGESICDDPSDPCYGTPERFINRSPGYDSSKQYIAEDDDDGMGWDYGECGWICEREPNR